MNTFITEITQKKQLTHKLYELSMRLKEPGKFAFKAGQCVGFVVDQPESKSIKKLYSITSDPATPDTLSFCVDVSPMGVGSKFVLGLKEGDQITIEGPHGAFVINDNSKDLLFVATGAGIAPFKSMILDALKNGYPKQITLLFGVRDEDDKVYFEFFEKLSHEHSNFIFIPTLSQPKGTWNGAKGRVTAFLEQNPNEYLNHKVYICGAPEMVKDVRALLIEKGFSMKDIKLELFV